MTQTLIEETCLLCQDVEAILLIPGSVMPGKVGVLKCPACGLVFLESRCREDEIDPEEKAYWDKAEHKEVYLREEVQEIFKKEFEGRLGEMKRSLGRTGKLLDVGSGIGDFLKTAREQGWEVRGLNISPKASEAAHEVHGFDVAVGTLEEAAFREGEFDAVTLWDVIEHIRRPLENLKAAWRMLGPGGILVMKTPDEDSLFKWMARTAYRFFGKRASFLLKYVYYVPHYFSYSRRSMTELLRQTGFEVITYQKDETPLEFAVGKIEAHYSKDPKHRIVISLLPWAQGVARLLNRTNKMVVFARKVGP